MTPRTVLPVALALGLMAAGLILPVPTASARPVKGQVPQNVWASIDSTVRAMYGPEARVTDVYWYGPFQQRGDAGQAVGSDQLEDARRDIGAVEAEVDPVWFGSTSPMRLDPLHSRNSRTIDDLFQQDLRVRRATVMNARTGSRGVLATGQNVGMDKPGAYLVMVRRPPGMPTMVGGRNYDGAGGRDTLIVREVSVERHEPDFYLGPVLGAMFLSVEGNEFFSPMYGGSVRKGVYTLFIGEGRVFSKNDSNDDRFRFGGLRIGPPNGMFFQAVGIDARQLILERDVYTHRAIGGTGGIGYQRSGRHFNGSVAVGGGGFNLVTPKQFDSESSIGFYVTGHAGLTF
ncbi:MAG: hypothetical protein ABIP29_01755 [Candidatus Eisenbacteria bacterium]